MGTSKSQKEDKHIGRRVTGRCGVFIKKNFLQGGQVKGDSNKATRIIGNKMIRIHNHYIVLGFITPHGGLFSN